MRVLFDNSTPRGVAKALQPAHEVTEARAKGWDELKNGDLLSAAEAAGFAVLVTPDQNMLQQQNLAERQIALIILGEAQWPYVRNHLTEIAAAVNAATPGSITKVAIQKVPKAPRLRATRGQS